MPKHLFIPTAKNNFTARLLSKKALSIYTLILLGFNMFFGATNTFVAEAALDYNQLYELHNEERKKAELPALVINTDLIESATAKGQAMLETDCWSHYCPEGVSPWSFFDDAGYIYVYAGENLAEGFSTVDGVMQAWMNSPTHRDNVLNQDFTEIGIGVATGDYQGIQNNMVLVVHFGSRKDFATDNNDSKVKEITTTKDLAITSPNDGDFLTTNQPNIIGAAPDNIDVEIFSNGDSISPKIHTTGDNFTYRPSIPMDEGKHALNLISYINSIPTDTSDTINITIDTIPPKVDNDDVNVTSLDYLLSTTAIITIKTSDSAEYISLNVPIEEQRQLDSLTTEYEIKEKELTNISELIISSYDTAGNYSITQIPIQDLLVQIDELKALYPPPSFASISVLAGFTSKLLGNDIKQQVNIIFVLFITALFGIDFYVLHKSGLTGQQKGHSHLHFSLFAILFVILITANFTGDILTGQSTL